jgi:hypothetical protein
VSAIQADRYRVATDELEPLLDRVATLRAERATAVAEMRRAGLSLQQIAATTGLSAGRVQELAKQGGWRPGEGGAKPGRPVDLRKLARDSYHYILSWTVDDVPGHKQLIHSSALLPGSEHRIEVDPHFALCELVAALDRDLATADEIHRELGGELRRRMVEALSGHTARHARHLLDPSTFSHAAWSKADEILDDPGNHDLLRERLTPGGPIATALLINAGVVS